MAEQSPAENAILDGEIVCLGPDGRSIFNELLFRRGNPVFYVFDLLFLNGRDIRQLPLVGRKQKLRSLVPQRKESCFLYAQHVENHGREISSVLGLMKPGPCHGAAARPRLFVS
jgi:bifunctional non-homologous end joining protein LigD